MSRSSRMHATATTTTSTTTTTTTTTTSGGGGKKLKGVRCRKWGKWVSEIRVPGTQERLWLGTYATPEAAAVAHDVAVYCLRRPPSLDKLNFPETLSSYSILQQPRDLSPRSVQKVASDVAMDVDARNIIAAAGGTTQQQTDTTTCERGNNNVGVGAGVDGSAAGVSWWNGLGHDHDCATFQGSESEEGHGEGEALSISVEDYF